VGDLSLIGLIAPPVAAVFRALAQARIRIGETDVSYSGEGVGWRVFFDGPIDAAASVSATEVRISSASWASAGCARLAGMPAGRRAAWSPT
jgi:hypothetical protein